MAGASNISAVTPEPSLSSCAWPTRRPGTPVMRLFNLAASQRNRVGFDDRNFARQGQRLALILGLRRAVAVDHLVRDLAALREKPADDGLRVWGAQAIGSFVIAKAPVIAAGEPLLPRRALGVGFQKRLHLRAPVAGTVGGAECVKIGQGAEDFG